jgi:hypothetical protein
MPGRKHVVPTNSGWAVKTPHKRTPDSTHRTQSAAEQAAKDALRHSGGGEAVIHDRHGRIRDSDTVPPASDPHPPKDTKH